MKTNMDYWDFVLHNLPKSCQIWFDAEKKYLHKMITHDAYVLEVGCGDGRSIFDLLQITENIVGIDHDNKAIVDAKKNFSNFPSVQILKADATKLPFEEEKFDFVICMTTFANFADQKFIILEEMKRVLKYDGKIIISIFSENALEERMKVYKKANVEIKEISNGKVVFDKSLGDNISEQFSKSDLENIFSQVDLHVMDITQVNIAYLCTLGK